MPNVIHVLLADDHTLVREGLRQILEDTPGVAVVGQAGDGAEALALATRLVPDVVILAYSMPGKDAPAVIGELQKRVPHAKIESPVKSRPSRARKQESLRNLRAASRV